MNPKMVWKICVDIAMTAALLLLMAYERIGEAAHEWIGFSMFVLFVLHHILSGKWSGNLRKDEPALGASLEHDDGSLCLQKMAEKERKYKSDSAILKRKEDD